MAINQKILSVKSRDGQCFTVVLIRPVALIALKLLRRVPNLDVRRTRRYKERL